MYDYIEKIITTRRVECYSQTGNAALLSTE